MLKEMEKFEYNKAGHWNDRLCIFLSVPSARIRIFYHPMTLCESFCKRLSLQ